MCECFCNVLENDENFLENVWFSDEAHFCFPGMSIVKAMFLWGSEVPDASGGASEAAPFR